MINLGHALDSLRPGSQYTTRGDTYEGIEWNDSKQTIPTKEECEAERVRLEAEYTEQEYARNRATAYASTGDQLDMQYWDSVNDTTTWKDHIASVKTQFPKG